MSLRTRAAAVAAALLATVAVFAGASDSAPAQTAAGELAGKLDQLQSIDRQQAGLSASIDEQNAQIDALIGDVSRLMQKEDAVQAELDQVQARLDQANAELNKGKAHLRAVRAQLQAAVGALEDLLVDIYKSGRPDLLGIVLTSSSWDELIAKSEYLERIRTYDQTTVDRVRGLREEIETTVARLAEVQERIKGGRDAILSRRDELAEARAQLDSRRAELAAARDAREARLSTLDDRERELAQDLAPQGLGPGATATLLPNGQALAPAGAPLQVRAAIDAANRIATKPYIWGGGHGSFESPGYDCSGALSYALHGAGFLSSPLDSTGLTFWGSSGPGTWITVYGHTGHAYAVIAGLRWDTSGGNGPRWHSDARSPAGFIARHPSGF